MGEMWLCEFLMEKGMDWRVGGVQLEVDQNFSLDFVKNREETNAILVHFFVHAKIEAKPCNSLPTR